MDKKNAPLQSLNTTCLSKFRSILLTLELEGGSFLLHSSVEPPKKKLNRAQGGTYVRTLRTVEKATTAARLAGSTALLLCIKT